MDTSTSVVFMGVYVDTDRRTWRSYRAALQMTPEGEGEMYWTWEDTGETMTLHCVPGDALCMTWQRLVTPTLPVT